MRGAWWLDLLQQHFLECDIDKILRSKPSPRLVDDFIAWALEKNGIFSARRAYCSVLADLQQPSIGATSRAPDELRAVWSLLWRYLAPPKVCTFAWRVVTNSLPIWNIKYARNMEMTNMCVVLNRKALSTPYVDAPRRATMASYDGSMAVTK